MAEAAITEDSGGKTRSKLPFVLGLVLMLLLGGGGFFAVYSGLVLAPHDGEEKVVDIPVEALPDIAFVPVESLVVSLGASSTGKYLHFTAQLEVMKAHEAEVVLLLPRVLDVLNGYLRAVDVRELEDSTALVRLRAQMLRRVQVVAGDGRVRDLLITEFVIN
ncbi:MAG: flagellar basal body-associated FliL family protein [Rhodobacteraceae bacterium]|nr:flagellar basal body-associated FliL family protein [Paracoccaceae bacterium]